MTDSGLKKNFVYTVIGMATPVIVALATIPIYLHHIGEERYGVLSIVWLLLGYFGFLDMGLSRASANALARLRDAPDEARSRVFSSSLYLNLGLGVVGGALIYFAGGYLFRTQFNLTDDLWAELARGMPWVAAMLPLALASGVGFGALESRERFLAVNLLQMTGSAAGQVVPALCAVFISPSLEWVIPAAFLIRLLTTVQVFWHLSRVDRLRLTRYDRGHGQSLFKYGAWVSVTNIVGPILTSLDQFVIGSKLGPAAVSHYSVPMNLTTRVQIIAAALSRAAFPRLSRYAKEDALDLAERSIRALAYLFGAACIGALFLVEPFLALWISPSFGQVATPVAHILLLGAWINGLAFVALSLLQGQGRPDLAAKIHLLELLPFIGLLWFLIDRFGLPGAAAAWTLRVGVDALLMFQLSGLRWRRLWTLLPAGLLLVAVHLVVGRWSLGLLPAVAAGTGAAVLVIVVGLVVDRSLRTVLLGLVNRFRRAA
ncbi:MAG: flippase [Niveispirillum sp.]|uniref:flippase n=1 Tax=Niveispirillum sp. TaxID=1917217 RepID=UPI003BA406D3